MIKGFACGVFDLFHAGHVRMLKECKQHCDYLIVALNKAKNLPAAKNKPIYPIEERIEIMQNSKYVDEVQVYNSEEELYQLMKSLKPDIRFLGEDYKEKSITGKDLNIKIHYTSRNHGLSTSGYLQKIIKHYNNC